MIIRILYPRRYALPIMWSIDDFLFGNDIAEILQNRCYVIRELRPYLEGGLCL